MKDNKNAVNFQEVLTPTISQPDMTISNMAYVMHAAKVNNDAKVSLHIRDGVRYLCMHKRNFTDIASALSYLREDARNIMAPENRKIELEVVS